MEYIHKYQDKIFLLPDDASPYDDNYYDNEHLTWTNNEHDNRWGYDNNPDSEYHEMMRLDAKYNFTDYENAPNYVHAIYMNEYKVTKKETKFIKSTLIESNSLINEFYNT